MDLRHFTPTEFRFIRGPFFQEILSLPCLSVFSSQRQENNITSLKHIHSRRKTSENHIFPLERRKPPVRLRNLIQKKSFVFGLFNVPTSDMKGSWGKLPARPVEGKVYIQQDTQKGKKQNKKIISPSKDNSTFFFFFLHFKTLSLAQVSPWDKLRGPSALILPEPSSPVPRIYR